MRATCWVSNVDASGGLHNAPNVELQANAHVFTTRRSLRLITLRVRKEIERGLRFLALVTLKPESHKSFNIPQQPKNGNSVFGVVGGVGI